MRVFGLFFLLVCSALSALSFREQMGNLNYLETKEDHQRLSYYENHLAQKGGSLPKTVHLIWLGSSPFPKESARLMKNWVKRHPNWQFKLWSDQERPALSSFSLHIVSANDLPHFFREYQQSDNEAERAALLRLEILYREGGVVIDHDTRCLRAFDDLNEGYDFYAALKPLSAPIFSSSVQVSPHILAAKAGHPLIAHAIAKTQEEWESYAKFFPGADIESTLYRVKGRCEWLFDNALFSHLGRHDLILPASALTKIGKMRGRADHLAVQSWIYDPNTFIKKTQAHLDRISDWNGYLLSILLIIAILQIAAAIPRRGARDR